MLDTCSAGLVTETLASGTGAPDSSSTLPVRLAEATACALTIDGATAMNSRATTTAKYRTRKLIRCISTPELSGLNPPLRGLRRQGRLIQQNRLRVGAVAGRVPHCETNPFLAGRIERNLELMRPEGRHLGGGNDLAIDLFPITPNQLGKFERKCPFDIRRIDSP